MKCGQFIFLPLLFVSVGYTSSGKICELPSNCTIEFIRNERRLGCKQPQWTTSFYIAAPVFAGVMLTVIFLKYLREPRQKFTSRLIHAVSEITKRFRLGKSKNADEENQVTSTAVDHRYKGSFFLALRSGHRVTAGNLLEVGVVDGT